MRRGNAGKKMRRSSPDRTKDGPTEGGRETAAEGIGGNALRERLSGMGDVTEPTGGDTTRENDFYRAHTGQAGCGQ